MRSSMCTRDAQAGTAAPTTRCTASTACSGLHECTQFCVPRTGRVLWLARVHPVLCAPHRPRAQAGTAAPTTLCTASTTCSGCTMVAASSSYA